MMPLLFFSESSQRKFLKKLVDIARTEARPEDGRCVFVSSDAFADAFTEADFDAYFIKMRRGNKEGNSEGKLAGIIYFRLTRHRFVHLPPELVDEGHYRHFQERIIIKFVASLLRVDLNDPWIRSRVGTERPEGLRRNFQDIYSELKYLTCRRHYNQESLALFFDTAVYLQQAIDEVRGLESAVRSLTKPDRR